MSMGVRSSRRMAGAALLAVLLSSGTACSREIQGSFAWASNDDRGIEEPERSLLLATEFRIGREELYFFDYETIWWIYQIQSGSYDSDGFLAALYENNLTPDPVEVDLRRVRIQYDDGYGYIRQFYEGLAPGRYLLKIAYQSKVVDQVEFQVVPPGGPAEIENGGRYAEADLLLPGDADDESDDGADDSDPGGFGDSTDEESDDILRYSSG